MRKKLTAALFCSAMTAMPALAAPPSFVDDLVTPATYDVNSMISACTTGISPKWMVWSVFGGEVEYEQIVTGGGKLTLNSSKYMNPFVSQSGTTLVGRVEVISAGWHGLGLGGLPGFPPVCLNEPAPATTNLPFTNNDICLYGGYSFDQFELTLKSTVDDGYGLQFGPDNRPGAPGVDDDGNGLIDDDPNCSLGPDGLPGVPGVDDNADGIIDDIGELYFCGCGFDTQCLGGIVDDLLGPGGVINQANSRRNAEYLAMGADGCSGVCGVDDDGNGIIDWLPGGVPDYATYDDDQDGVTDEIAPGPLPGALIPDGIDNDGNGLIDEPGDDERQPDLAEYGFGDDPDDIGAEVLSLIGMRSNIGAITTIALEVDPTFLNGQFQIQDVFTAVLTDIHPPPAIAADFYQAGVHYSYAFCASGSSYGAQLWIGDDIGNPVVTVGPAINTTHLNPAVDTEVATLFIQAQNGIYTPFSNKTMLGNKYFGNRFWVLQGPPGTEDVIVGADRDADFDVDGIDFTVFASCFNKSGNPPRTLGCTTADAEAFDLDGDGDVDGIDFTGFASCFNKSGNPPRALGCVPQLTGS